jgi:transcriptional regulator with GAF, ATPase, and Fis domain
MDIYADSNTTEDSERVSDISRSDLAKDRVHKLKSLIELVLHELNSLEKSTSKNGPAKETLSLVEAVEEFEARLIRNALVESRGNQRGAARLLSIKHTTFHTKMRRYQIDPTMFIVSKRE